MKQVCFKLEQNDEIQVFVRKDAGSEFQSLGAATEKVHFLIDFMVLWMKSLDNNNNNNNDNNNNNNELL